MCVQGSEQRLIQAARGGQTDGLDAASVFEEIKEREKIKRLEGESSTWTVFEAY